MNSANFGPTARNRMLLLLTAFLTVTTGLVGCGKSQNSINGVKNESAIIGGQEAVGTEGFAKTIVMLYNVERRATCTGSILSNSIILTAAHCVVGPAENIVVVFGTDASNQETAVLRRVDSYKVSPLWPFRSSENINSGDIAVVHFNGGVPSGYRPTKVLSDVSLLKNGDSVMLAGYGMSNGLTRKGSGKLRFVRAPLADANFSDTEVLIDQSKGTGACHGDSGGPAYVEVDGETVLFGITNRGVNDPKDTCGVAAAFASVAYWTPWIEQTAQELIEQSRSDARLQFVSNSH